jgi:hypothetical protein
MPDEPVVLAEDDDDLLLELRESVFDAVGKC